MDTTAQSVNLILKSTGWRQLSRTYRGIELHHALPGYVQYHRPRLVANSCLPPRRVPTAGCFLLFFLIGILHARDMAAKRGNELAGVEEG